MSVIAKFALVPTSDANNQIMKYSDDYVQKVLNDMKTKHAKEVETTYWCGEVLTPQQYEQRIDQVRETIINNRNKALDEFDKQYHDAIQQHDDNICIEHRQKISDALIKKRQALVESYNETLNKEIEHIRSDMKKEEQFLQILNDKKTELKHYTISPQIVIDEMKHCINHHKQSLQYSLGDIFTVCFEEKINSEFPCPNSSSDEDEQNKHNAHIRKVIDYAYKLNNYKLIMKKFISYSDYMEKSLLCWLPLITRLDITEKKHMKVLKDGILSIERNLSDYICELVDQIISSVNNPTYVAANMKKDYAEYIINEIYEQFTQKLVPQIDNYYNELYTRETRKVLSTLFKVYHIDLGDEVKQYFDNTKDWYEREVFDWKSCFNEIGLILQSIIQQPQQTKHEPKPKHEEVKALPQPPVVEEVEDIKEVVISNKPSTPSTTSNDITFQGFIQTLANDEIRGDDLVKAYNEYFATNTTAKSLCQEKEFKQYFKSVSHKEHGKKITYYIKK